MTNDFTITPYSGPPMVDAVQRAQGYRDQIAFMHMAYGAPQPQQYIQPYDAGSPIVGHQLVFGNPRHHGSELPGVIIGAIVGAIVFTAIGFLARSLARGVRRIKGSGSHRAAR